MPGTIARRLTRWERALLQRVYGFDRWHVGHAGEAYAQDIVRALNAWPEAGRESAVEIGCGLGDILRRLAFRDRLGLDRDAGAIAAARLLARFGRGAPPRFERFEFPRSELTGVYNAIIMVNWIHQVDPETLRAAVHRLAAGHLRPGGAIVLDTVADPAYEHNHDIRALAPAGAAIAALGSYPRGRHVWVVR
ncbi:MAG TPA: methyltransferase [Vicinamibacterales bacterium]|jgi:SAM-dependent methyltransferase|nr:methyltransferase [Vicinamibacterales bacterium]